MADVKGVWRRADENRVTSSCTRFLFCTSSYTRLVARRRILSTQMFRVAEIGILTSQLFVRIFGTMLKEAGAILTNLSII